MTIMCVCVGVFVYQGAEALRWVSARDVRRLHSDLHEVLHGGGSGLTCIILPRGPIIRAHQRLTDVILAQRSEHTVQEQADQEEHGVDR